MSNLNLGMTFIARDLASPVMGKLGRNFGALNATMRRSSSVTAATAAGMGGLAIAAGGAFAALSFANAAGNFNQQLQALQQITGATTQELTAMEDKILDVGLRTKFSPDDIVEGMKNLGAAGLTAGEAMDAIEPSALLATAGQIQLDEASRAIVGTLKAFSLEADKAGIVSDKLAKATQISNLQAQDFEIGLSKASGTMATFGQSMDDTLVGLGALRNANIDASSASTALRESARRVFSDPGAKKQLKQLGIDTDSLAENQHGLIESIFEVEKATSSMTQAQKNDTVAKIFGARGLLAFNSISKLTFKTIRDGQEVTLKGAEAFAAMREQIAGADGTVTEFNDALLDTFQGQKQLLSGAVDTLKVVLGQGFAQVFKPVVKGLVDLTGRLAKFVKDMTPQSKELVAKLTLIGSAVMGVVGAFFLLGGPVSLVIAGVVAAVVGLKRAIDSNLNGIGDRFRATFGKVKVFFKGFAQLISDGFLSGDTLDELLKNENKGVLKFLTKLVAIGFRIKRFFSGITQGFREGMEKARPTFKALKESFGALAKALGFTKENFNKTMKPSERFVEIGKKIGNFLAKVIEIGAKVITWVVKFRTGMVNGFKSVMKFLKPVMGFLKESFSQFVDALKDAGKALGLEGDGFGDFGSIMETVGKVVGGVAAFLVNHLAGAITFVIKSVTIGIRVFTFLVRVFKGIWNTGKRVVNFFKEDIPNAFKNAAQKIRDFFDPVIKIIEKTIGKVDDAVGAARDFAAQFGIGDGDSDLKGTIAQSAVVARDQLQAQRIGGAGGATASAAAANRQNAASEANAEAIAKALKGLPAFSGKGGMPPVQLIVDGEKLAESVANGEQQNAASEFGE